MEDWELIKIDIENTFGVDFDSRSRKQHIYFLRALYFATCKAHTSLSLDKIGRTLRNRFDHSTVLHGINVFHNTIKDYRKDIGEYFVNFQIPNSMVVRDVDLKFGKINF